MRILFLFKELPYPPYANGAKLRGYQMLESMNRLGHSVSLVCFYDSDEEKQYFSNIDRLCKNFYVVKRGKKSIGRKFQDTFFQGYPLYRDGYDNNKEMENAIDEILEKDNFDVCYLGQDQMAVYHHILKGIPAILDATDAWNLVIRTILDGESGIFRRMYLKGQLRKVERHIKEYHPKFNMCLLAGKKDIEELHLLLPSMNAEVVPLCVDTEHFSPMDVRGIPRSIVFTGNMGYKPNQDAVIWFCNDVLPLIRNDIPDTMFYIVGRNPSNGVMKLVGRDNGVIVTGGVDDIRPYIAKAEVYVCPIRQGGGIKIKLLEAMAMGKAIVSTREGVDGIPEAVDENDMFIASSRYDLAEKTKLLLSDENLRKEMSGNARRLAEKYYSKLTFDERLNTILKSVTSR